MAVEASNYRGGPSIEWARMPSDNDPFTELVGPFFYLHMVAGSPETLRFGFVVQPKHCNRLGVCHGGLLATFLDIALGLQGCGISGDDGTPTIQLSMDYLAPALAGDWVESQSRLVQSTRRMNFVEGTLHSPRGIVVRGNGIFRRTTRAP